MFQKAFSKIFLLFAVLIILAAVVGGLVYWQGRGKVESWGQKSAAERAEELEQKEISEKEKLEEPKILEDEKTNWKIYQGREGKIKLYYPENWNVYKDTSGGDLLIKGSLKPEEVLAGSFGENDCFISILGMDNSHKLDLFEYFERLKKFYEVEHIKIGSHDFVKWRGGEDPEGNPIKDYSYAAMDSEKRVINFHAGNSYNNKDCQKEVERILLTFERL